MVQPKLSRKPSTFSSNQQPLTWKSNSTVTITSTKLQMGVSYIFLIFLTVFLFKVRHEKQDNARYQ